MKFLIHFKETKDSTRPKRPCYLCGIEQSQIVRPLKRKHRNEKLVQLALCVDKKQHNSIMDNLRKIGIDKCNQVELGKTNPIIQRERRPAKHSINDAVCSTKCLGVCQRQ